MLTNLDKGRYGVLIFENLNKYLQMDKWNRELLDKYCREYSVGIVGFAPSGEESLVGAQLKGFPLFVHTNLRLKVSPAGIVLEWLDLDTSYIRGNHLHGDRNEFLHLSHIN